MFRQSILCSSPQYRRSVDRPRNFEAILVRLDRLFTMSTWRRRFSRRSIRSKENDEILMHNTIKYRKKLQAAIGQINRTKKSVHKNFDSSDSDIHVARLINDIGQLSDCRPLQEISGLIDSLAMRQQLSSRIFNEYAMSALQTVCERLNDNLSKDFDQTKSVLEEAKTNYCSSHTKSQLKSKVQHEWCKHQKLAVEEFKRGLSSYCQIGVSNLKLQMTIMERLQKFVDQFPQNDNDENDDDSIHRGFPNFSANSLETRQEIDAMLRVMLDAAPNYTSSLPAAKKQKFLNNHLTLSNSVCSPEAAARSRRLSSTPTGPRNSSRTLPSSSTTAAAAALPQHESIIVSSWNDRFQIDAALSDGDNLPSYSDLFVVPSTCKDDRVKRRTTNDHNHY